jgi:hypothetical protein
MSKEAPPRKLPTREELRKKIAEFWERLDVGDHDEDCSCSECLCVTALSNVTEIQK